MRVAQTHTHIFVRVHAHFCSLDSSRRHQWCLSGGSRVPLDMNSSNNGDDDDVVDVIDAMERKAFALPTEDFKLLLQKKVKILYK